MPEAHRSGRRRTPKTEAPFDSIRGRQQRRARWRLPRWLLMLAVLATYLLVVKVVGLENARRLTFAPRVEATVPASWSAPVDQFLARCPTKAQLQEIDSVVLLRFDSDPTARQGIGACHESKDSRDLTAFQKRVYNSIRLLKEVSFDEALPWTSKSLFDWFAEAAETVVFRDEISLSFCCRPDGVINLRTRGLAISETDRFIDPRLDDGIATFILLLLHETRHAEGFRHTCGTNADLRLTEMGAWGLQYSLDVWMADHGDPTYFAAPDTDYRQFFMDDAERIVQAYFCLQPTPAARRFSLADLSRSDGMAPKRLSD
jgi:hypothetical protein